MATNRKKLPEIRRSSSLGSWRDLSRLQRGIDRIFDNLFLPFGGWQEADDLLAFVPAGDIEETDKSYVIRFDLPGVSKNDIDIQVRDNQLVVSGQRREEHKETEGGRIISLERSFGSFNRSFTLPSSVNADQVDARFENGVLEIQVPKAESAKRKVIEIEEKKGGKAA